MGTPRGPRPSVDTYAFIVEAENERLKGIIRKLRILLRQVSITCPICRYAIDKLLAETE